LRQNRTAIPSGVRQNDSDIAGFALDSTPLAASTRPAD
jgi:hypothetical protein